MRGKASGEKLNIVETWDHPRLCGEKRIDSYLLDSVAGSPPPMRGKGFPDMIYFFLTRITPAYAGKRF